MEVHVPHDVILNQILPRVPAKSVGRFKCVSKEWHSFLMSDMFQNMYIDHHQYNLKLLVLSKTEKSLEFATIDCEAPPSDKGLTPTRRPLPPFEGITPYKIRILASFHGLVCLGIHERVSCVYSHLILWNPLTNEYKRLSKSYSHKECNKIWWYGSAFGLYYSCCEDDYKLLYVNFFHGNVYIYSLRSDSWRKVHVFQHTSRLYNERWSRGTYLNENLYFLENSNDRLSSIIRFDTKTEQFSKIKTPNVDDDPNEYYFAAIVVKNDCIHVCVKYDIHGSCDNGFRRTTCIKLWKLDEYGNMKEVLTYQLRPHVYDFHITSLIPFHLMKNGKWLMRNECDSYKHKIYEVDLINKKKHYFKGKGNQKGNIYDDVEYAKVRVDGNNNIISEEGRYIETFVSPNRYMK
ncbi:F-box/kelch-repeat protein-like protein [Tanacetum coccineum]